MDKDRAGHVVDIAARVVASGAISANGHGDVSVRVPGAQEMYSPRVPPGLRAAALQRAMTFESRGTVHA